MDGATVFITSVVAALVGVLGFLTFLVILELSGSFHYEYRCVSGVVEARKNLDIIGPLSGFSPLDGDPAGACR